MTKKQTPLPQTGGSFTRQKDGSLKPANESSRPEADAAATPVKTAPANTEKD